MALKLRNIRRANIIFAFLLFLSICISVNAQEKTGKEALLKLLPSKSQITGWEFDGAPETAVGQELYLLINGGAEIYMQEGFERAVLASYINGDGKVINLEIFEMASQESAKRIYMKKISHQGKKVLIGDEAILEDYFINFRKGRFQATLSGYDSEKETVSMLLSLAKMVANKISTAQ